MPQTKKPGLKPAKIYAKIWQPSFTHHLILNPQDMEHHREYILDNPVRAGLVKARGDYPYSSAQRRFRMDSVDEIYFDCEQLP